MRKEMQRSLTVDWELLHGSSQEPDQPSLSLANLATKGPKWWCGNYSWNFEMWVVYQKGHCSKTSHAMCLKKARYITSHLPKHGHNLVVVLLYLVMTTSISCGHSLSLEINNMRLKSIKRMMYAHFQEVITILRVTVHHDNRGLGLTPCTNLIFILINWSYMGVQSIWLLKIWLGRDILSGQSDFSSK